MRTAGTNPRAALAPWLVLAISLVFTAAATLFLAWTTHDRDAARFQNAVQGTQDRITQRLEVYLAALRGGTALFAASDSVTAEEFHRYAEHLDLQRFYPGIQGIGWTERVVTGLSGPADEHHAIRYLEPMDARNRAAIGFDMYSQPIRREAMRRARDEGEPALSGPVTLVQEIFGRQQTGFLLYLPVYRGGEIPETVEARRARLRGFVYSPFRADDLFAGIFGSEAAPRVSFRVYDGTRPDPSLLLHASPRAARREPALVDTQTFTVIGRPWTVIYASEPAFERASTGFLVPVVALTGLLVSLGLFRLAWGQARARIAAEEANRAKASFLSAMSHELRTPLNAIAGYVDLLDLGIRGPINATQRNDLQRIKRAQQHLLTLINDVLSYAKLEAGRLELVHEPVLIAAILDEIDPLLTPQFREGKLEYRWDAVDPGLRALGDPDRIRQILLNLLSNAAKFTPAGGEIAISTAVEGEHVVIEVSDTGRGIPADQLDTIFEAFVQVDRKGMTSSQQGVGLGLAISRELAAAMGGRITVRSELGVGSTFRLELPRAQE